MGKSREKNRFVIDKNQLYEYNITTIVLGELCNEGIIVISDIVEALIKLRNLYNLPLIDIYNKKKIIAFSASVSYILKDEPLIVSYL